MSTNKTTQVTITQKQRLYVSWTSDVLVYIVVLNLFVEFVDAIVIDSFWISILTAVLLKALLDVVMILFTSKFIILEVVDIVFGDHVELGHFIHVLVLIIAMIVAKALMVKVYKNLGESTSSAP